MFSGFANHEYNQLAALLKNKAFHACGSNPTVIRTPQSYTTTSFGAWLFKKLGTPETRQKFENALIKKGGAATRAGVDLSHAMSKYVRARWLSVTICALGVAIAVLAIVSTCTLSKRLSARCMRCLRIKSDSCEADARHIQRALSELPAPSRLSKYGHIFFASLCLLVVVVAFALGISSSLSLAESRKVVGCNMWLELSGYFNGATEATRNYDYESVDWNAVENLDINEGARGEDLVKRVSVAWVGSQPLRERLLDLNETTWPSEKNPLREKFHSNRITLQSTVESYESTLDHNLESVEDYISAYDNALDKMKKTLKPISKVAEWGGDYSFLFALKKVYQSKKKVFIDEVRNASTQAWGILDGLIEKYAGVDSALLKKANAAVVDALAAVERIDGAMKSMYNIWESAESKFGAYVISIYVLACITAVCSFVATGLVIHMGAHIIRFYHRRDTIDSAEVSHRNRCWLWASVFCRVGFATSAVLIVISHLGTFVGTDLCQTVDQSLLTEGRWEILGSSIIDPSVAPGVESKVSIRDVLDVCVKRNASGSISTLLGLDGALAEVSDDMDAAIDDINTTRDRVLLRNSRHMRVGIIGFLINELLRGFTHEAHFDLDGMLSLAKRIPVFNNLQDINFENQTSLTEGRKVMLGPVPYWPIAINSLLEHGLQNTLGSIVDAYSMLDTMSSVAQAKNPETKLPLFCGQLARKRKLACSYYPAGGDRSIVELSDPTLTYKDIENWVDSVDDDIPSWGNYTSGMSSRLRQLIGATMYVERAANLLASDLDLNTAKIDPAVCHDAENQQVDCTFDDARQFHQAQLDEVWNRITDSYENLVKEVDDYVNLIVIPTSQDVIKKANDVVFDSDCQFQGTMLDNAVYAPLCWSLMPTITSLTLLALCVFCAMAALQVILWSYRRTWTIKHASVEPTTDDDGEVPLVLVATTDNARGGYPHHNTRLMVPSQRSVSNTSMASVERPYGSESFAPIYSQPSARAYD